MKEPLNIQKIRDEYRKKFFEDGHFGGSYYSGWQDTGEEIEQFIETSLRQAMEEIYPEIVFLDDSKEFDRGIKFAQKMLDQNITNFFK